MRGSGSRWGHPVAAGRTLASQPDRLLGRSLLGSLTHPPALDLPPPNESARRPTTRHLGRLGRPYLSEPARRRQGRFTDATPRLTWSFPASLQVRILWKKPGVPDPEGGQANIGRSDRMAAM